MRSQSPRFFDAVRAGGGMVGEVAVYRDGDPLDVQVAVISGQVVTSRADAVIRRRLTCELVTARPDRYEASTGLWETLVPGGATLVPKWTLRYINGATESVPLGVFDVDEQSFSYGSGDGVTLVAPDRWQRVVDARFEAPFTVEKDQNAVVVAANLISEAIGEAAVVVGEPTALTGAATWDTDRAKAVTDLLVASAYEAFIDVTGVPVLRPVPVLTFEPVWWVEAGAQGTLLGVDRARSRQGVYNVVVVTSEGVDGNPPWRVVVEDTNPASPTFVGTPAAPRPRKPMFYRSELITDPQQGEIAGRAILDRVRALPATLSLTAAPNPALEPGDTVGVQVQQIGEGPALDELHLLESVTYPLVPGQEQRLETRASRLDSLPEGAS